MRDKVPIDWVIERAMISAIGLTPTQARRMFPQLSFIQGNSVHRDVRINEAREWIDRDHRQGFLHFIIDCNYGRKRRIKEVY